MSDHIDLNDIFARAMQEMAGENYDRSVALLTDILVADADHKMALTARGAAFLKSGRKESAIDDFDRVLAIDPGYARARHLRGLAFEARGQNDEALSDFDRAIELNPEYGAAYFSRANLHAKMGREDLASQDFETIAHLTNRNIESFANQNNVWRSQQMHIEQVMETELNR